MKRFKIIPLLFTFIFIAVLSLSATPDSQISELVILHTNDHHGTILPNNGLGGLAERVAYIRGVQSVYQNVLVLDAGDINSGTALSNMFRAEPDILVYNQIYDAVTFGNHDLGYLDEQMGMITYPLVTSNIKTADGNFLGGNQYLIKNFDGFTVGIFGITITRFFDSERSSLVFINEIDAARDVVDILLNQENVDIVIGLVHMGNVRESPTHITSLDLAAAVPGIDIIIDGHSHTSMQQPIIVGDTYIVSVGEWGRHIGYFRLIIQSGSIIDLRWAPVAIGPDPEITALLRPYIERASASLTEVIGQASDTFDFGNRLTRYQETTIGNVICDANVWYFRNVLNLQTDFAFHNGGTIRAELPAGQITRENVLTVLPFDNILYNVSMLGSDLIELFNYLAAIPQGAGDFPQFSKEVRYTIDVNSRTISNLTIDGLPIDPNRVYRFSTNQYVLDGGDGQANVTMNKATEPFNSSLVLSYILTRYIEEHNLITPALDGRMTVIGGVTP